ncbi:hypothetical protein ONZ45_g12833 [Pleurotus djamor]|nr:hypothetical protein ONZ45_g12833 [Pleurotus djamor]
MNPASSYLPQLFRIRHLDSLGCPDHYALLKLWSLITVTTSCPFPFYIPLLAVIVAASDEDLFGASRSRNLTNDLEYIHSSPSAYTSTLGMDFDRDLFATLQCSLFRRKLCTLADLSNDLECAYSICLHLHLVHEILCPPLHDPAERLEMARIQRRSVTKSQIYPKMQIIEVFVKGDTLLNATHIPDMNEITSRVI